MYVGPHGKFNEQTSVECEHGVESHGRLQGIDEKEGASDDGGHGEGVTAVEGVNGVRAGGDDAATCGCQGCRGVCDNDYP